MIKNVIFDLYGTLIDIKTDEEDPVLWKKMCQLYGDAGVHYTARSLKRAYFKSCQSHQDPNKEYSEIDILDVFEDLLQGTNKDDTWLKNTAVSFRTFSRQRLKPYRKTKPMLETLKEEGKKIYLLSNAQSIFTMDEIRMCQLDRYFDDIFLSSDYGIKKPDPAFMKELILKHDLKIEECVMVGNEFTSDIALANMCGMRSIYVNTGGFTKKQIEKMKQDYTNVCIIDNRNLTRIVQEVNQYA